MVSKTRATIQRRTRTHVAAVEILQFPIPVAAVQTEAARVGVTPALTASAAHATLATQPVLHLLHAFLQTGSLFVCGRAHAIALVNDDVLLKPPRSVA